MWKRDTSSKSQYLACILKHTSASRRSGVTGDGMGGASPHRHSATVRIALRPKIFLSGGGRTRIIPPPLPGRFPHHGDGRLHGVPAEPRHNHPGVQRLEGPIAVISFLGILLDTLKMEIRLPPEKLAHLQGLLAEWRNRKRCKKRALLSLIGKLSHACKVITPGCIVLKRMIETQ